MTRFLTTTAAIFALTTATASARAESDGTHLELGVGITPTFVQDTAYEAFSRSDLRAERIGADLRVQVLTTDEIALAPFFSYRGASDDGEPYDLMDTELGAHDFTLGLRLRAWFLSWLGVFVQAEGGLTYAKIRGDLNDDFGAHEYSDEATTWCAGGLLGIELRLPPSLLERQGIRWLNFGLEVGGGYLRRGQMDIAPSLEGGDDNALPVTDTADFGDLNLSGWTVQVGFTVSLF